MKRLINYFKYAPVYRHVVVGLIAVVVFVTTYSLILPAISLEKDKQQTVSGLEIRQQLETEAEDLTPEMAAHVHDDSCYALEPVLDEDGNETGTWKQVLTCTVDAEE